MSDDLSGAIGFSREEIEESPPLNIGEMILCPHCGEGHVVAGGRDIETGEEMDTLLFYTCGETSYLAGVGGKNIMRRFM